MLSGLVLAFWIRIVNSEFIPVIETGMGLGMKTYIIAVDLYSALTFESLKMLKSDGLRPRISSIIVSSALVRFNVRRYFCVSIFAFFIIVLIPKPLPFSSH